MEWFIVVFIIYFIPSFVAARKEHSTQVFLLNLFLGWTVLGWIGSLVWASGGKIKKNNKKRFNPVFEGYLKQAKRYLKKGDIENALDKYEAAVLLEPTNKYVLIECARLLSILKRIDESFKYVALATKNNWSDFGTLQSDSSFKNLTVDSRFKNFALSGYSEIPA